MLNNGSKALDEILEVGNMSNDVKGIGFDYNSMSKEAKFPTKKFSPLKKKTKVLILDHMSQHPAQHMYPHYGRNNKSSWKYHHCGIYGNITPYFYILYGYPHPYSQPRFNKNKGKETQAKKVWKPKEPITYLIAHTSLRVSLRED